MIFFYDKHWYHSEALQTVTEEDEEDEEEEDEHPTIDESRERGLTYTNPNLVSP